MVGAVFRAVVNKFTGYQPLRGSESQTPSQVGLQQTAGADAAKVSKPKPLHERLVEFLSNTLGSLKGPARGKTESEWDQLGFSKHDAKIFSQHGFTPVQAQVLRSHDVPSADLQYWRALGFNNNAIMYFSEHDVPLPKAQEWANYPSLTPDLVVAFHKAGWDPEDAHNIATRAKFSSVLGSQSIADAFSAVGTNTPEDPDGVLRDHLKLQASLNPAYEAKLHVFTKQNEANPSAHEGGVLSALQQVHKDEKWGLTQMDVSLLKLYNVSQTDYQAWQDAGLSEATIIVKAVKEGYTPENVPNGFGRPAAVPKHEPLIL